MQLKLNLSTFLFSVTIFLFSAGTLAAQCTFTPTDIVFGSVETLTAGNTDISGNINVSCGNGVLGRATATISASIGSAGANGTARQMSSGTTSTLSFQLYREASRTTIFGTNGDGFGGQPIFYTGGTTLLGGGSEMIPFFGRVFGGQSLTVPGTYQSQITLNIQYQTCVLLLLCTNFTTQTAFLVTAQVQEQCILSATDMDFGSVGLLSSNIDTTGNLNVLCTPLTNFQISLDDGVNASAALDRKMQGSNGSLISYNLFLDSARTALWGSTLSVNTLADIGSGTTDVFPIYGRVPPQTTPMAGIYTDTIIVTLTY